MLVDDEAGILDQAKIFLERINGDLNINPFISAFEGLKELETGNYDAIVSDYQMPKMDGLEFLKEVRKRVDIPFIMFTGKGREDVAIEALNLGANHYIQKGGDPKVQFEFLADVIDKEIRLYQGEKAKANLASIVRSSQNAIISKDLDGHITSWNRGAEQIYGFKKDEVLGKNISIIFPEDKKKEADDILKEIRDGNIVKPFETVMRKKDGNDIHILLSVSPVSNNKGDVIGASAVAQDITEKKESEEKIKFQSAVLENMDEGVYLIRVTDGIIVYTNPAFERLFGYEPGEMIGEHVSIVNAPTGKGPEETAKEILDELSMTGKWEGEIKNIKKNGTEFWCYAVVSAFDHYIHGKTWISVHTDITKIKESEKEIKNLNRALRLLSEVNSLIVNIDNERELLNKTCEAIVEHALYKLAWIGYAFDDEEKTVMPIAFNGYKEGYLEDIEITWSDFPTGEGPTGKAIKSGESVISQNILNDPNFEPWREEALKFGYQSSIALPLKYDGKTFGALNIYAPEPDWFDQAEIELLEELAGDLSYGINSIRMKKEKEKKEEKIQFQANLLNSVGQAVIGTDLEGNIIYWNRGAEELYGWSKEEVKNMNILDVTPAFDNKEKAAEIMDKLNQGDKWSGEFKVKRKDGTELSAIVTDNPVMDEDGNLEGIIGITTDITELKETQEELEKNVTILNEVEKLGNLGGWEWNINEDKFIFSKEWQRIHGTQKQELSMDDLLKIAHPDDISMIKKSFEDAEREKKPYDIEHRIIRQNDGEIRFIQAYGEVIFDDSEKPVKVYGTAQDITEEKKAEEEREELLQELGERNKELNCLYRISSLSLNYDKSMDEILQDICYVVQSSWQYPDVTCVRIFFDGKEYKTDNFEETDWCQKEEIKKDDEQVGNIEVFYIEEQPEEDEGPFLKEERYLINSVAKNIVNISERREVQEELEKSEEDNRFKAELLKNAPVIAAFHDTDNNIKWSNKAYEKATGRRLDDIIGKKCYTVWGLEEPCNGCPVLITIETGEPAEAELTPENQDNWSVSQGSWLSRSAPIYDKKGELIGAVETAIDITKRNKAENRIIHLNRVLKSIRSINQIIIRERDKQNLIDQVCEILIENRGYNYSWIALFDKDKELENISYSGIDEKTKELFENISQDTLPECVFNSLEYEGIRTVDEDTCKECLYYQECESENNLSIRLEYEDVNFGVLNVSLPKVYSEDKEEISLLEEVAGDISFSLYNFDMKEKIETEEKKSSRIIDTMLDGFVILDREGVHSYVNDAFCKMTGFSRRELIGKGIPHPYWPEDRIGELKNSFIKTKSGNFKDFEQDFVRKDGGKLSVIISPECIKDGSGNIINYFASFKDITKRKEQELELEELNKRLKVLLSNIQGMVYRCRNDRKWTMEFVSNGSIELTGYTPDELIKNKVISYGDMIHPEYRDYVWTNVQSSVKNKTAFKLIYKIIDKKGKEKWVWEQGRPVFSDGSLESIEGIVLDITERKELEDRERFLHDLLRHDLKNKVNVVYGYLDLLADKYGDEKIIKRAIKATKNEIDLIEKVRVLNKIGEETIKTMNIDIILDKVISEYKPVGVKKGIEIRSENRGAKVLGGMLLEDLFDNIIENAIYHSEGSLIEIGVGESMDEIIVSVEDDGIGIDDKFKGKLFDKSFSLGKDAGTGIGLFLCKEIIENYGGNIEVVDSDLGGTRFDLHLNKAK